MTNSPCAVSGCKNEAKTFALVLSDDKASDFAFCRTHLKNLGPDYMVPDPKSIEVRSLEHSFVECKLHAVTFEYEPQQFTVVLHSLTSDSFLFPTGYIEASLIYGTAKMIYGTAKTLPNPIPITHELIGNIIQALGGSLTEAIVDRYDASTDTYKCHLVVESATGAVRVDCRVSDAVALTLLAKKPLKIIKAFLGYAVQ